MDLAKSTSLFYTLWILAKFLPNTRDYGFFQNFRPNTIDYGFWPNLHPNSIDCGLWPIYNILYFELRVKYQMAFFS